MQSTADGNRAGFVGRLARIRVECGKGELVGRRVVHWDEHLALLHSGREESSGGKFASPRTHLDLLLRADAESDRIARIDLHVDVLRMKLPEYGALPGAGLRVPLGGSAAASQQQERILGTCWFR